VLLAVALFGRTAGRRSGRAWGALSLLGLAGVAISVNR
jgi:hypothetical protein